MAIPSRRSPGLTPRRVLDVQAASAGIAHRHQHRPDHHAGVGDRHGEGIAWNNLGVVLQEVRRFVDAIEAFQQAVAVFEEVGDDHNRDIALANLAALRG
ncbi:tetratricopeptide repeat protein [Nonomuraea sp. NPDC050790]|uniref:tetratricopeptide repeat protein n=1 Tax=Nonomuraea sp. NPDC050790 TaxID=3364371 RepID=UPI0037B2419E